MIGGMVDPGEDYAEAAVREAREETGLVVEGCALGLVARAHHAMARTQGAASRAILPRPRRSTAIDTSGLDEREKSWTLDHRWWSADEIAASTERFEPKDLGARLKALLRDGPPTEPVVLSSG